MRGAEGEKWAHFYLQIIEIAPQSLFSFILSAVTTVFDHGYKNQSIPGAGSNRPRLDDTQGKSLAWTHSCSCKSDLIYGAVRGSSHAHPGHANSHAMQEDLLNSILGASASACVCKLSSGHAGGPNAVLGCLSLGW